MSSNIATELKPCPFCDETPQVGPFRPEIEGDCVGYVRCGNPRCPARPVVSHGIAINDDRGTEAYQAAAITRWNRRAAPSVSVETKTEDSVESDTLSDHVAAVLQKTLNLLLRYCGWERNYRPDGVELPMSRPRDVQEVEKLCATILSRTGDNSSAVGASLKTTTPLTEPASGKFKMSIFEELLRESRNAETFLTGWPIGCAQYELGIRLRLAIERVAK